MKRKIKQLIHSLTFRIVLVACITIIPINILLIITAKHMIHNVEEALFTSYQNALSIHVSDLDNGLDYMRNALEDIMQENYLELQPGYSVGQKNIAAFEFWKKLKTKRENNVFSDLAFLKVNWDNSIYITNDPLKISYVQKQEVADYLGNNDLKEIPPLSFEIININNQKYLLHLVNYEYFSFGMLCDLDNMLENMEKTSDINGEKICLVDKQGNIIAGDVDKSVILSKKEQVITINQIEQKCYVIYQPSVVLDYEIARIVPFKEINNEIPFLEKNILVLGILSFFLIPVLIIALYRMVLRPLKAINHAMQEIEKDNIDYRMKGRLNSTEFEHVKEVFNNMAGQIQNLRIESYEKDIERLDIEKTNLRLQINPHLLLNSLNMIYSLAQSQNYKYILDYTLLLVEYFRYSLRNANDLVTLKEEIHFVKNYLEIQKIRFPEKFTCVYDIDEGISELLILPLIIENFVENSIKYALKMDDLIEIILIIKSDGNKMSISICDTGCGMSEDRLQQLKDGVIIHDRIGKHIGIWNCRRRLNLYYGEEAVLSISSSEGYGTQVWMEFPVVRR
ncbi:HAMP domain-containing protein [Lachnotalea glycerini]|nr:histidine kinase [Lachnotalea glycerini]PXV89445.1 HAMP domain-containing protein [Lachnotalea glycerini]